MQREISLVRAELRDCIQDLAEAYQGDAEVCLKTVDMLQKIRENLDLTAAEMCSADRSNVAAMVDIEQTKMLLALRKRELTERYTRLLMEFLLTGSSK